MKLRLLAVMASALSLATAARAESYTFTAGEIIPIADSENKALSHVTIENCNFESQTSIGSTHASTRLVLSLNNQTQGDYVLTVKGGAGNGNSSVYRLSASYVNTSEATHPQITLKDWDLVETGFLAIDNLPAGEFTVTFSVESCTTNYAGNFGDFKIVTREAFNNLANNLPSDEISSTVVDLTSGLLDCDECSAAQNEISSTKNNTYFSFLLNACKKAKYSFGYKTGANGCSAHLNWALYDISGNQIWAATGTDSDAITDTGDWTPTVEHTHVFGEYLDAGLYVLRAYVSREEGDNGGSNGYAGNYGDFTFSMKEVEAYTATVSSLVAWGDYYETATSVIVEEGGAIVIDATDKVSGGIVTLPTNVTLPDGASASDYYVIKTGAATTETFNNDGTVTIATVESVDSTTWACAGSGDWATAANWTHGAPSGDVAANFKSDASATLAAPATVKTLDLNGHAVTLTGSKIVIDSFDPAETGVLKIKNVVVKSNGVNGSRKDLDIPAGISIVILADGNNASTFEDNYGDVNVHAPLIFEDGARLVMNYKTPLLGGASGRGVISAESGNDDRIFAGDWRAFTGEVSGFSAKKKAVFADGFATSSSTWSIYSAEVRGSVSLGVVNFATDANCVLSVASGVNAVALAGGSIGANVTIPEGLAFNKTGTGTLTLDGCTLAALTVSEGAIAAGASAPTVGTLTMAPGSYVAASATSVNANAATVDGVKVLINDASALQADNQYTLVRATTLSGKPERFAVDTEGNTVSAGGGLYWLAKASGGNLSLGAANPTGFMIIIR